MRDIEKERDVESERHRERGKDRSRERDGERERERESVIERFHSRAVEWLSPADDCYDSKDHCRYMDADRNSIPQPNSALSLHPPSTRGQPTTARGTGEGTGQRRKPFQR